MYLGVAKRCMQGIRGKQRDVCRVSGGSKEIYAVRFRVAK